MQAPTAVELLNDPTVQQALDQAWADSQPNHPAQRHEEGGWSYLNPATGAISILRASSGGQAQIDLSQPPIIAGSIVAAKFHTYPNPTAEGWNPGPSKTDLGADALHGVPTLIWADNGVYVSGPSQRRGGLGGEPGYPALVITSVGKPKSARFQNGAKIMATTTISSGISQPRLSSDGALKIARLDAERAYRDLTPYRFSIALEADGWHIDYELKDPQQNGGGPRYVIDPHSGAILAKQYEQ